MTSPHEPASSAQPGSSRPLRRSSGRHHQRTSRKTKVAAIVLVVLGIGIAGAVVLPQFVGKPTSNAASLTVDPVALTAGSPNAPGSEPTTSSSGTSDVVPCPRGDSPFTVAASPEIASVLRAALVVKTGSAILSSCTIRILDSPSGNVVEAAGADPSSLPDVWIPDSASWLSRLPATAALDTDQIPRLATSPILISLSTAAAESLESAGLPVDLQHILASRAMPAPIRYGLPNPRQSTAGLAALLGFRTYQLAEPADRAAMTWAMRSSPRDLPATSAAALAQVDSSVALPVSEQALWSFNSTAAEPRTPIYGGTAGAGLDYPFTVLAADAAGREIADAVLSQWRSDAGRELLLESGFRDSSGSPGEVLTATGWAPAGPITLVAPTSAEQTTVLSDYDSITEPSRLLAVLDVSGSMAREVPGTRSTRLELAKAAAAQGLGLYSGESAVGLWAFSKNLTPDTDYQELVPVGGLSDVQDGRTGSQRIAAGIDSLRVNVDGGTGLYDTVLAAVRSTQASYDPNKINSVLILSDGENIDDGSISLETLLSTLAQERDQSKPVQVITIALGPDSDAASLEQISGATGGSAYIAQDPRDIRDIFLDSVGLRLCRPEC